MSGTAVPRTKVRVGYNYPWAWEKYGLYFGGGAPPGSDPVLDAWVDTLKINLPILRNDLGITLVRIFLMCNLANVGGSVTQSGDDWFTDLPLSLDPKFTDHLTKMLQAFKDNEMQVIPSFVDFGAMLRLKKLTVNGIGSGCTNRYQLMTDRTKGDNFLDRVLDPLLFAAQPFKDQVFAWELMNEPSWCTSTSLKSDYDQVALRPADVRSFLVRAVRKVDSLVGADGEPVFKSTVGHRYASDMSLYPTGAIRQFHYYPTVGGSFTSDFGLGDGDLPSFQESGGAILGEFAAGGPSDWKHTEWPEIPGFVQRAGADIRMLTRLQLLESKGYGVALIWPDRHAPDPPGPTDTLRLSPACQKGVKMYQAS
jgi:hypothetical protein